MLCLTPYNYYSKEGGPTPYTNLDMYFFLRGSQSGTVYQRHEHHDWPSHLQQPGGFPGRGWHCRHAVLSKHGCGFVMTFQGTIYSYAIEWSGLGRNQCRPSPV